MMKRSVSLVVLIGVGAGFCSSALGARKSPNLAEVKTATFIGSKGTEWLTSAAFPGDDGIIITGVSLDPELTLRGVKAKVIGEDAPALSAPKSFRSLGAKDTKKTALPSVKKSDNLGLLDDDGGLGLDLDEPPTKKEIQKKEQAKQALLSSVPRKFQFYKEGKSVEEQDAYARLCGAEPSATGFIGRFDSALKQVRALFRLPRGAGTIQSVVLGKQGEVYIAGGATERIAKLSSDRREEEIAYIPPSSTRSFPFRRAYVARLSPDLSEAVWVRDIEAHSYMPVLRVLDNGNVSMLGPSYLVYDPAGKLVQATSVKKRRVSSGSAVCPKTGRFTQVGDWMSSTGREPYRCPRLIISRPDGTTYKNLLGWRGRFFCPNHFHLVADSAVRRTAYDKHGNLFYSTWSHGGNNCCGRFPYDAERHIPNAMNTPGSSTYCFVVKLDPEHNVKTSTLWTTAGSVYTLFVACDGSPVWEGRGTVRPNLPNTLAAEHGQLMVVTEPNIGSYRFISALPAVGTRVVVGGCVDMVSTLSFASGKCGGRPMLLCLSGAVAEQAVGKEKITPPLKNPAQAGYGGGLVDGYALLLDITAKEPLVFDPPTRVKEKRPYKPYEGPRRTWPEEGQKWLIGTEKCVTVKMTVRDEEEKMWPSFFLGNGVAGGSFTYGKNAASADFTLDCWEILQPMGVQTQRILGELVFVNEKVENGKVSIESSGAPKVKVHFREMSPWKETGGKYGLQKFPIGECTIKGVMDFGGREIAITGAVCRASFSYPHRDKTKKYLTPNYALPYANFTVSGKDLGLTGALAEQRIKIRVAWEAVSTPKWEKVDDPNKAPPPKLGAQDEEDDVGLF